MVTPMEQLPAGFYVGTSYCIPYGLAGNQFMALPGPPQIELDGRKQAQLTSLALPDALQLGLQATWTLTEDELAAMRQAIARRYPALRDIELVRAPLQEVQAWLELGPPDAPILQTPPQPASMTATQRVSLSVRVPDAARQAALSALGGAHDQMRLVYRGQLELLEKAHLEASGDLGADLATLAPPPAKHGIAGWFSKPVAPVPPDRAACLAQLQRAVQAGRLTLKRQASPNASAALSLRVESAVLNLIAEQCEQTIAQARSALDVPTSFTLRQQNSGTETGKHSIRGALDCGAWLQARTSS